MTSGGYLTIFQCVSEGTLPRLGQRLHKMRGAARLSRRVPRLCKAIVSAAAVALAVLPLLPEAHASGQPAPSDPQILAVQTVLREEQLYPGEVNGVFDVETEAAIRHYQILHELRVTGKLDSGTRSAMHLPEKAVPEKIIQEDQRFLRDVATAPAPQAAIAQTLAPTPPLAREAQTHASQRTQPTQRGTHRTHKSRFNRFGRRP